MLQSANVLTLLFWWLLSIWVHYCLLLFGVLLHSVVKFSFWPPLKVDLMTRQSENMSKTPSNAWLQISTAVWICHTGLLQVCLHILMLCLLLPQIIWDNLILNSITMRACLTLKRKGVIRECMAGSIASSQCLWYSVSGCWQGTPRKLNLRLFKTFNTT